MAKGKIFLGMAMTAAMIGLAFWQGTKVEAMGTSDDASKSAAGRPEALIQDADLLAGWNNLRSLKEPVALWNGGTITGEQLAQFLLDAQIPVVWGSDEICGGGSCSRQYCTMDGKCSFEDGKPGIDPIYINPSARDQKTGKIARLVNELAHEIFHRTQPFGTGPDTQLEEFWAFYAGSKISGGNYPVFDGTDPFDPQQLQSWFANPIMRRYLKLEAYPNGIDDGNQRAKALPMVGNHLTQAAGE
jgi:hypothetical protein